MVFHRQCLILSPYPEPIVQSIGATGDKAFVSDRIERDPDWVICFGHQGLIREPELTVFKDRIVNLHISYLPWGRGTDPNLWAWVNGEPHGVTLHYVDAGIDTGDIIAQRLVDMDESETLRSSYDKLHEAAVALFRDAWPALRNGRAPRTRQSGEGSSYRLRDRDRIALPQGWDTPVSQLRRPGHRRRDRRDAEGVPRRSPNPHSDADRV